ncbi:hypothetical protein A7A08_02312 [Methyloligella halotolerans]|uniref:Uncharacterized protein n=1 Tax=Methyloligella halotolerans TaxID=1177755 RepID=A0A1E2RY30_9HYPH|nr:hypothetical protein [Methyloligella halotolerans]ODA67015.1 hypothetical protein A7A08_02312 [Methyloligella halotolerans]
MTGHKFKIGEKVQLARDPLNRKTGIYEVLALLPEEHEGWQYRIQDPQSKQQRVVIEARLSEVAGA